MNSFLVKSILAAGFFAARAYAMQDDLADTAQWAIQQVVARGSKDRRVPIAHAERLRRALSEQNRGVDSVVYADEAHGLRHENNRVDFRKHVEQFRVTNLK